MSQPLRALTYYPVVNKDRDMASVEEVITLAFGEVTMPKDTKIQPNEILPNFSIDTLHANVICWVGALVANPLASEGEETHTLYAVSGDVRYLSQTAIGGTEVPVPDGYEYLGGVGGQTPQYPRRTVLFANKSAFVP
jgi:hypothetical protein